MIIAMSISASDDGEMDARQRRAESMIFFHRAMALCEKQIRLGASLEIGMRAGKRIHAPTDAIPQFNSSS